MFAITVVTNATRLQFLQLLLWRMRRVRGMLAQRKGALCLWHSQLRTVCGMRVDKKQQQQNTIIPVAILFHKPWYFCGIISLHTIGNLFNVSCDEFVASPRTWRIKWSLHETAHDCCYDGTGIKLTAMKEAACVHEPNLRTDRNNSNNKKNSPNKISGGDNTIAPKKLKLSMPMSITGRKILTKPRIKK